MVGHRGRHVAENSRKFVSALNSLTSCNPTAFDGIQMPAKVREGLLANDFSSWEDVAETTNCSTDVLGELQKLVQSLQRFDPPVVDGLRSGSKSGFAHN
jgi:hypothetical protein